MTAHSLWAYLLPIALLAGSHIIMMFAWYGHLKFPATSLIAVSTFYLKEPPTWNHLLGLSLIAVGGIVVFKTW